MHSPRKMIIMGLCIFFAVVDCVGIPMSVFASNEKTQNLVSVADHIKGQVVQIVLPSGILGSGFWIDERGYIATCWHVVSSSPTASIQVQSAIDPLFDLEKKSIFCANWEICKATLVARDEVNDIAILKAEGNPFKQQRSTPISINGRILRAHYAQAILKRDLPNPGEKILLAGYPLGQPYTVVQEGTVASIAYDLPGWGSTLKILISTVANHGNSGGPVLNDNNEVIGLLEGELRNPDKERTGIEIVIPTYFLSKLMSDSGIR